MEKLFFCFTKPEFLVNVADGTQFSRWEKQPPHFNVFAIISGGSNYIAIKTIAGPVIIKTADIKFLPPPQKSSLLELNWILGSGVTLLYVNAGD